jgi:hypothetical protein
MGREPSPRVNHGLGPPDICRLSSSHGLIGNMLAPRVRWLLALAVGGIAPLAFAQPKNVPPPTTDQRFAIPGSPDSVSTGQKVPSSEAKARRAGANAKRAGSPAEVSLVTFPGFRLLPEGRSRIYVELTRPVTFAERRNEKSLVYTLHGTRVLVRNNKNALITTHFATPVARARLISVGPDVELVIDLRKAVGATPKIVPGDNGTARLEIDFPTGDYPLAPALFGPTRGAAEQADVEARGTESAGEGTPSPAAAVAPTSATASPVVAPGEKSGVGPPGP